jgi:hypothetical protein
VRTAAVAGLISGVAVLTQAAVVQPTAAARHGFDAVVLTVAELPDSDA